MTDPLSQKTFKVELEFTVSMDEITEVNLGGEKITTVNWLKRLQKALVTDENTLIRQMLAALFGKLQEYSDYLAAQDPLEALRKTAAGLESEDPDEITPGGDFASLTRPLRTSSMTVRVNHSAVQEKSVSAEGEIAWKPIWTDLRQETESGKQMEKYSIPLAPAPFTSNLETNHYLLVRYLSRQPDGVHAEGRCTCQLAIEGSGEDESQALDALWRNYQRHMDTAGLAKRIQHGLESVLRKPQYWTGND